MEGGGEGGRDSAGFPELVYPVRLHDPFSGVSAFPHTWSVFFAASVLFVGWFVCPDVLLRIGNCPLEHCRSNVSSSVLGTELALLSLCHTLLMPFPMRAHGSSGVGRPSAFGGSGGKRGG